MTPVAVHHNYNNANPAFGCLHHVEVGSIANISDEQTAPIIRADMTHVMWADGKQGPP